MAASSRRPLALARMDRTCPKNSRHQPPDVREIRRAGDLAGELIYFGGQKVSSNDLILRA
jgi:hypothetical protein